MTTEPIREPWESLEQLVGASDSQKLEEYLDSLPLGESARALARMSEDDQTSMVALLEPTGAATLFEQLPDAQAAELIQRISATQAAAIVGELASDQQVDLLAQLSSDAATAILQQMDPEEAAQVEAFSRYEPSSAGGLMITEYLSYTDDMHIADVLEDLSHNADEYASYDVQYAYVTDAAGRLVGVLRLRDLLLSQRSASLRSRMIENPLHLPATATLDELEDFFSRHEWVGVPVVDEEQRLVGVVRREAVEEEFGEQSERAFMKFAGIIGGEELRSMKLRVRCARRLSWLTVNIFLNILAASVIAAYQDTLAAAISLAVFLPIISDMSGCSGNQSVAVSMRELALGLVRPYELRRVLMKELGLGLINGVVLGLLLGGLAYLWKGNAYLGLVVGAAMAMNTIVAVSLGGGIPLVLERVGLDPALISAPVLTTVTDMCGFLLVLGLATLVLAQISGV